MVTSFARAIVFILVVSVVALLPGCGWGGGDTSISTTTNNVTNTVPPTTNNPTSTVPPTTTNPTSTTPTPVATTGRVFFIETDAVTDVSDTAATLHGRLTVSWAGTAESAYFRLRQVGGNWGNPIPIGQPNGAVFYAVAGLTPNTTYESELLARVGSGVWSFGGLKSFTTTALPPTTSGDPTPTTTPNPTTTTTTSTSPTPTATPTPTTTSTSGGPTTTTTPTPAAGPVVTGATTNVNSSSAVLHGSVNGIEWTNGAAYFLLSLDKENWTSKIVGRPRGEVTTTVTGLQADTNYWVRLIAVTGVGTPLMGEWVSFRTSSNMVVGAAMGFAPQAAVPSTEVLPQPLKADVQTRGYTDLRVDGATLHGYVYVNGERGVAVWFQWSLDGATWETGDCLGLTDKDNPATYTVRGLFSEKRYYYRLVAGSSGESLRYGQSMEFQTLAYSDTRGEYLNLANSAITNMKSQAESASSMADQFSPEDANAVWSVVQSMDFANDSERRAWYFLNMDELSTSVPSLTASNFIDAAKVVTEARTKVSGFCEKALNRSWNAGMPSVIPPPPLPIVMEKAGELSGKGGGFTFAGSSTPTESPLPWIDRSSIYLSIVNSLIDGLEASRTIVWNLRWSSDVYDFWNAMYVTELSYRAYVAELVISQFVALPEVSQILDTSTKNRLEEMRKEMRNFRMSQRSFEDDRLAALQRQSRSSQISISVFMTGIPSSPPTPIGLGKASR